MVAYPATLGARTHLLPTSPCFNSFLLHLHLHLHLLFTSRKTASSPQNLPRSNYDQQTRLYHSLGTLRRSFSPSSLLPSASFSLFSCPVGQQIPSFWSFVVFALCSYLLYFQPSVIAPPRNGVSVLVNGLLSCQQPSRSEQHSTQLQHLYQEAKV